MLSMRVTMMMTQLQESEDEKKDEGEAAEKKDDSIVYADLDKSAMSEGDYVYNLDLKMLIMIVIVRGFLQQLIYQILCV